jgi:hypothetical protein
MEHACHRCGSPVEDGVPFCAKCNAPQIRFIVHEEPELARRTGQPEHAIAPLDTPALQWHKALRPAALAGIVAAFAMAIPGGMLGFGMLAAGVLAVLLYQRRVPGTSLTPGSGARLGALAGLVGFVFFAGASSLELLVFRADNELRTALLAAIDQAAARSTDPQARQIAERLKSPEGLAVLLVLVFLMIGIAAVGCASLGGALGAWFLQRKHRD